jgi:hypothetical protein
VWLSGHWAVNTGISAAAGPTSMIVVESIIEKCSFLICVFL